MDGFRMVSKDMPCGILIVLTKDISSSSSSVSSGNICDQAKISTAAFAYRR
jgi:hypothetical protein